MFAFNFFLVLIFLALLSGCAAPGIPVQLTPTQSNKPLGFTFTRAYYAPTQSGEDQIVLVSDPIDQPVTTGPGKPLPELKSPPIWYVLLIDLHWRSAPAGNQDSPVGSNASLHFYVFGATTDQKTGDQTTGVLHYSGTGSVWLSAGNNAADVSLLSGEMTLADQHGQLLDPFKKFQISADFHAITDGGRLEAAIADVRKAIAEADGEANSKNEIRSNE